MKYEVLTIGAAYGLLGHLCADNQSETGLPGRSLQLCKPVYDAVDRAGSGFVVIARAEDGSIVGFCSVFLSIHQHTSIPVATNDSIFVVREWRNTSVGGQLMVRAEFEAKRRGAEIFMWQVVGGTPIDAALASRPTRYSPFQKIYLKELQHGE